MKGEASAEEPFGPQFQRKLYLALAVAATLGILILGVLPSPPLSDFDFHLKDKLEHASGFCVLAWLYSRALALYGVASSRLLAFVWACVVGASLELIQWQLPYRSAELGDLIADSVGALMSSWGQAKTACLWSSSRSTGAASGEGGDRE